MVCAFAWMLAFYKQKEKTQIAKRDLETLKANACTYCNDHVDSRHTDLVIAPSGIDCRMELIKRDSIYIRFECKGKVINTAIPR